MSILIPGRAEFYDDSPRLTPEAARQRFADWFSGRKVLSGMVAVGRIIPSEADLQILKDLRGQRVAHRSFLEYDPFFDQPAPQTLQSDFLQVVQHDMARVGVMVDERRLLMHAGNDHGLPWHSDMARFVRWNISEGEAGTEGMNGWARKEDYDQDRLEAMLEDGALALKTFPPGTVLRFMPGDIHRSPEVDTANRIFMSDTVMEENYQTA